MTGDLVDEAILIDIAKILVAIICGGIIGFERELKDKPAGLRTIILVSTGSCLFVIFGLKAAELYEEGPGRIIGPIITGIGFLGAGTIIRSKGSVRGLTSAATIWVVAGVGMMAGMEQFVLALIISIIVFIILIVMPKGEEMISSLGVTDLEFVIISSPTTSAVNRIREVLKRTQVKFFKFQVSKDEKTYKIKFYAHGRSNELFKMLPKMLELPEVIEAKIEDPRYSY